MLDIWREEVTVTLLFCLPLLVKVDHLWTGLLHLLHGAGSSVWNTGDGGHGSHPQLRWENSYFINIKYSIHLKEQFTES